MKVGGSWESIALPIPDLARYEFICDQCTTNFFEVVVCWGGGISHVSDFAIATCAPCYGPY